MTLSCCLRSERMGGSKGARKRERERERERERDRDRDRDRDIKRQRDREKHWSRLEHGFVPGNQPTRWISFFFIFIFIHIFAKYSTPTAAVISFAKSAFILQSNVVLTKSTSFVYTCTQPRRVESMLDFYFSFASSVTISNSTYPTKILVLSPIFSLYRATQRTV